MEAFPHTPFYQYDEGDAAAGLEAVSKELDVALSKIALRSTSSKLTKPMASNALTLARNPKAETACQDPLALCMNMQANLMQTLMTLQSSANGASSSTGGGLTNLQIFANRQKTLPALESPGTPANQTPSPPAKVPAILDTEPVQSKNLFETQPEEEAEGDGKSKVDAKQKALNAKNKEQNKKAPSAAAGQAAIVERALSERERQKNALKRPAALKQPAGIDQAIPKAKAKVKVEQPEAVETQDEVVPKAKAKAKPAAKAKIENPPAADAAQEADEAEVGGKGPGKGKGKDLKMDRKNIHCRAYNASLVQSKREGLSIEDAKKKASEDAQDAVEKAGFQRGK